MEVKNQEQKKKIELGQDKKTKKPLYDHCERGCDTLGVYDWMKDIPVTCNEDDIVEIRFKHTRKGYYRNVNKLRIQAGDIVAVEASPGHDIGIVSLTGELVKDQLNKKGIDVHNTEFKKVYRKVKDADIKKWQEAMADEKRLLIKSREVADNLKLDMKIGDVEYQGDKTKAIFYYIADERVDFREMIKILAEELKIRIEMRQIGARQEAGRIGGIGPCGRKLCCTSWLTNFVSVTTNAARLQDVSLNPQKMAGQCGKLKCCLNYEVACYYDYQKDFPDTKITLETEGGTLYHKKNDILRRIMWYSYNKDEMSNLIPLSVEKVNEVIELNKKGEKALGVKSEGKTNNDVHEDEHKYEKVVGQESISRFDKNKKRSNKKQSNKRRRKKRR